jgi:hypothetical protein
MKLFSFVQAKDSCGKSTAVNFVGGSSFYGMI